MLLEDCLAEMDIPLNAIDIVADIIEEHLVSDFYFRDKENKIAMHKTVVLVSLIKLSIIHLNRLQKKYKNIVENEYRKGKLQANT